MPKKKSRSINKSDLSRKRRQKRSLKAYVYTGIVFAFIILMILFFRMDAFQVKDIQVSGASDSNATLIKQQAEKLMQGNVFFIIPKTSVFFYPQQDIDLAIKNNFPSLSSIKVNTGLTGSLDIIVEERKPSYLWCYSASACYFMDDSGFIFARASEDDTASTTSYIKYSGLIKGEPVGQTFTNNPNSSFFTNISNFVSQVKSYGLDVSDINVTNPNDAEATVDSGFSVMFNPADMDTPDLYKNLNLFLTNMKNSNGGALPNFSYIDARYGNKIFYRLK